MKPNNISDVEREFDEKFVVTDCDDCSSFDIGSNPKSVKEFYRSQIEKLLGRIDTEEVTENFWANGGHIEGRERNTKSSEIANQILEMKK